MGKSNRCEIEGVIETLGSIRCLIAAIIRTSVVFSHTTTIHSLYNFIEKKKKRPSDFIVITIASVIDSQTDAKDVNP